ncbi:myosin-binding striated muscle assembly central domain-containing protein [Ditylenchus destructor]|uniref:Myosin-binding striated muscle assembly central domain-containing protein n=1 Tax=Ditylenchus destructor TaxID=166010 RepID=A0AAD4N8Z2_9BILA|nr:myosin-binding striated muscle assembly central domain-containing protein [Ditylenchus destructor]
MTVDSAQEPSSVEEFKIAGNEAYKNSDYQVAEDYYSKALSLNPELREKSILYKNRAMARLKLENFEGAESDCSSALEISPYDVKALYRRAMSREKLDKIGPAFVDAKEAARLQPNDRTIIELCESLLKVNTDRLKKVESTQNKVAEMMRMTFDNQNGEQKLNAINNLLVLCRDSEDGASRVWQDGKIVDQLLSVIKEKDKWSDEFALSAIRIMDELAKKRERACALTDLISIPVLTRLTAERNTSQFIEAASALLQRVINGLAAMDRNKEIKPDNEVVEKNKIPIIRIILEIEEIITDKQYSATVREISLDFLLKNLMHMDGGLPRGWSWRFVEDRGLFKVLHIACQIPELCDYPVTAETRQHVAIFLARLYDDMVFDQRRALYKDRVDQVFNGLLSDIDKRENRIKLAALLITLLQGPVDTGISLVTNDTVTNIMLQMAASGDSLEQSIAAELIVLSVSKHERATAIIKTGLPVLRKLFNSSDQNVKVRALVGLCKCAAAGGDDCAKQTMDEGTTIKLADICKKFLLAIDKYSVDVRRFACEGLSYLSLDADVKEFIIDDPILVKALVSLAQSAGAMCVFTLAAIYVNLSNAYEKPKIDEEMVKLAQFAKHHVPETHLKDTDEYVEKRVRKLVEGGAVTACVAVSKTESKNALDNLARCMNAFCGISDLTGQIISEGGAKLLLKLHKECSAVGKLKAAHGLAKLGARSDPSIAFPGQRAYEVVKPMVDLLHPEVEGLANYDALLTLTNLSSTGDSLRKRILKEKSIPKIEEFWFDNYEGHEMLRSAAAELLLNMLFCEDFFKETIKPNSDRVKLWVLYCAEGDERLKLASSAGFATLTEDPEVCQRILNEIKGWVEHFTELAMSENPEIQRRCLMGIANMVESSEKVASEIMASDVFRVLVAITKLDNKERKGAQEQAKRALDAAEKLGVIKATDRELHERKIKLATVNE